MNVNKKYKCHECDKVYAEPSGRSKHYKSLPSHRPVMITQYSEENSNVNLVKQNSELIIDNLQLEHQVNLLTKKCKDMEQSHIQMNNKTEVLHQLYFGTLPCNNDNDNKFEILWERKLGRFKSIKTRKFWHITWENYSKNCGNIDENSANKYLKSMHGNPSTIIKKKYIIEKGLKMYTGNVNIFLNEIQNSEIPKPKYRFSEQEISHFLEYIRWKADVDTIIQHKYREHFFFCASLAKYGMRLWELASLKVKRIYEDECSIVTVDTKNNNKPKKYVVSTNILTFLLELAKLKNQDDKVFSNTKSIGTIIRRIMISCPLLKHIDQNKFAVGAHCLRVSVFNQQFETIFNKANRKTKQLSQHESESSLKHYIKYSFANEAIDKCLTDIDFLGKKSPRNPLELDKETLDENFRLSCLFRRGNPNEEHAICAACYIIITPYYISCSVCKDKFHPECHYNNKLICFTCDYFSESGFTVRSFLANINIICRICNEPGVSFCKTCINNARLKIIKVKRVKSKKDIIRLIKPEVNDKLKKDYYESLGRALSKQNLLLYEELKYHECSINVGFNSELCYPNPNNKKIIEARPCAPVMIGWHAELGLTVYATNFIKKFSYIAEYIGDVYVERNVISDECDKFMLSNVGCSSKNLVICPNKGANLGKYVQCYYDKSMCNVATCVYNVDGKCRAIMYCTKDIVVDEILYCDIGIMEVKKYRYIKFYND